MRGQIQFVNHQDDEKNKTESEGASIIMGHYDYYHRDYDYDCYCDSDSDCDCDCYHHYYYSNGDSAQKPTRPDPELERRPDPSGRIAQLEPASGSHQSNELEEEREQEE